MMVFVDVLLVIGIVCVVAGVGWGIQLTIKEVGLRKRLRE